MKKNRILSSALIVIMLLMTFVPILPVKSRAAYSSQISTDRKDTEEVQKIVSEYWTTKFNSAEEMFQSDLLNGYLDVTTSTGFSVYVNRYTGVMYYRNEATGEMITSNSYNFDKVGQDVLYRLTSQAVISYSSVSGTTGSTEMFSSYDAARRNQISVTKIDGGLRVSYTMGNTTVRELFPLAMDVDDFESRILKPLSALVYDKLVKIFGDSEEIQNYFESDYYDYDEVRANVVLHKTSFNSYLESLTYEKNKWGNDKKPEGIIIRALKGEVEGIDPVENEEALKELKSLCGNIKALYASYNANHPDDPNADTTIQAVADGRPVYKSSESDPAKLPAKAKLFKSLCPNYTFDMMYEDEEKCGYVAERKTVPVFRFALEYTINSDGTLSVRLPSNSIVFDQTKYILESITPLPYFGAADFSKDGYMFIPDGSGSIIEYDDFRQSNVEVSLGTYGQDYCYSKIKGMAYSQSVTMPVYGSVSQVTKGSELLDTGFFAILEEGSSMATINVSYTSSSYHQGSVYTTFEPYPIDEFDLSDTISVGGAKSYSIVAESKYSGSYVTRYVMLSANAENKIGNGKTYSTSYIGMANYYRDYLKASGVLTEIQNVGNELPLYIEALGSIEVVEKVLTFPVKVSRAITTFDNVVDMYNALSTVQESAKARLLAKAQEYQALADAENDAYLKSAYLDKVASYNKLAAEVQNIDNINFKLTGFANGGMKFTYPSKVKWEKSLGGRRDFKNLLKTAEEKTGSGSNFGVYPEFDFQYVNNTKMFDGVGKRNTLSKMVDNRYASKQSYSNITGEFTTLFAMIVSPDSLDRLYSKFVRKYDNYDVKGISVSTLGSDLNSNFDEDNPISRDDAQGYVTALLDRIANESNYSVMLEKGNIYAVKYADHILNVAIDSSYYRYSSYTVPFVGMILHGYVNYSGAAFNYSGSPDYDLLRSIESGASLYYILGYQNTDLMKDDEDLNKYYSISYQNWFDSIVDNYTKLNAEIGDLQNYHIVDHKILIGERVIDDQESAANLAALEAEFVYELDKAIHLALKAAYKDMQADRTQYPEGTGIKLSVDVEDLAALAADKFELSSVDELDSHFIDDLNALVEDYRSEINIDDVNGYDVSVSAIDYESQYKYVTGSIATDKDYEKTDYTIDNDLIVMVTYSNGTDTRSFILNYNIYAVEVILNDGAESYVIDKYGFVRI